MRFCCSLGVCCLQTTAATGRVIEKSTYVFDLKGLSLSPNSVAMAIFKMTLAMDQAYFPERLHQAFFSGCWATHTPLLGLCVLYVFVCACVCMAVCMVGDALLSSRISELFCAGGVG